MVKKLILLLIIPLMTVIPLFSSDLEKLWGISKSDLITRLKLENYSTFKPEENPEYNNRIIDFFSSMNPDDRVMITVLRIEGKPEIDYCFFNEKLYSISEEWGNIDITRAYNLVKTLKEKYSEISTEEKNPEVIYSFKKNKTKVLLYKKNFDKTSAQVKIFYYSNELFSMLLRE